MKITDVEAIALRYAYPPEDRFQYAAGRCDGRLTTLILVHTEIDRTDNPFVDELLDASAGATLTIDDGQLSLGEGPGLGIGLDREVVERYRLADPLTVPDGVYSDMMFGGDNFPLALPYVEGAGQG